LPDFKHEAQSFRVADRFIENKKRLNLTYEVMDGVVCHCGEEFEQVLCPDRNKDLSATNTTAARTQRPATLEGCVVRIADRIAYLGRDMEDALEVGIISEKDVPESVRKGLGKDNGEIIGTLIDDVVRESEGFDAIKTSDHVFQCVKELNDFNQREIYQSKQLSSQFPYIDRIIQDLFGKFMEVVSKTERGKKNTKTYSRILYQALFNFIKSMKYTEDETEGQIVVDYLASMTDNSAILSFREIFLFSPPY
jgi:dGTPase